MEFYPPQIENACAVFHRKQLGALFSCLSPAAAISQDPRQVRAGRPGLRLSQNPPSNPAIGAVGAAGRGRVSQKQPYMGRGPESHERLDPIK